MASVRDIAKRSSTSLGTASRVLNDHPNVSEANRAKVFAAVRDLNYVATTGKRSPWTIAYVATGGPASLDSPYDVALIRGIAHAIRSRGDDLTIVDAQRAKSSYETYAQMLVRKGIKGAILRATSDSHQVCSKIAADDFPAVTIGEMPEHPYSHFLTVEQAEACREGMRHLIDLGHRRIAAVVNVIEDHDHEQRLEAYRQVMAETGIDVDPRWVIRAPADRESGASVLTRLMRMTDPPTAVFFADPLPAMAFLRAALEQGVSIPREMSVLGFDDAEQRFDAYPTLSAVCQDSRALGAAAITHLDRLIQHDSTAKEGPAHHRCYLDLQQSTGPLLV